MATNYGDVRVKCPFYLGEQGLVLRCEGIIGDGLATRFRNINRKENYMSRFCQSDYKRCRICRAICEKYDNEGNEKEED